MKRRERLQLTGRASPKSGRHTFENLTGGPIDNPSNAIRAFTIFGHLAVSWARLEQHVDLILIQVNRPDRSRALFDPNHPIAFSRKMRLLKKWMEHHPEFSKLSSILQLIDDMTALS